MTSTFRCPQCGVHYSIPALDVPRTWVPVDQLLKPLREQRDAWKAAAEALAPTVIVDEDTWPEELDAIDAARKLLAKARALEEEE